MPRRLHGAIFWPLAVGGVVALACLLTQPVHAVLVDLGWMDPTDRDFLRVFRRLLLIPLALVFLLRIRPWRGVARDGFGLRGPRARLKPALLGYGLTVLALVLVLLWQAQQGWLRLEDPLRLGEVARRLGVYLVGGLVAGLLEEWFFRGWLVARGTRDVGPRFGVLASATVFALIHAFRPSKLEMAVSHDAAGALAALRGWLGHMVDLQAFGPAALGLFCFALLLSAAYARTGTLWTSVGIHAGAVLVLFSYGGLTDRAPERTWAGTRLLYDGPVVWGLALGAAALLWPWGRRESGASGTDAAGSGP
ncbi:MAG: CPBP family intramembrane metalloprotease [Planctomycetota bacterium]|nr:CPBP family intramembrane metalloprotease [Planctomycetota bacterium]